MRSLGSFVSELRRRRVFRVAAAYCASALLVIEAANNIFPALHLPAWATTFVVVLAIVGLPGALFLAWAFDVTPDGVRRTAASSEGDALAASPAQRGRRVVYVGAALLVTLAGAGAYVRFRSNAAATTGARPEEGRSVAVLPFVNMSGQKENEYFSDGITEEILDALAHVPALQVAARTSSFAFKGKSEDVSAIARQLRVTHVLEGSVQREAGRVRITAELIDARTGYHVWSEKYTREATDIFALEDEISKAIAAQLQTALARSVVLAPAGTRSEQAHDLYLQGRQLYDTFDWPKESQLLDAIVMYRKALAVDSTYAAAWSGIADCYTTLADLLWPPARAVPLAREAALKALALDPTLADAHSSLGFVLLRHDWAFAGAEREARNALSLKASSARAHVLLAELAETRADWREMAREGAAAARLDPITGTGRGIVLDARVRMGEGARILDSLRAVVRARPADLAPVLALIVLSDLAHNRAVTREGLQRVRELGYPAEEPISPLGPMYLARAGETAAARQGLAFVLDGERLGRYHSPSVIAAIYATLGEREKALRWLERALRERDGYLLKLASEDWWDSLKGEPRYQAVRKAVGLP